MSYLLVQHKVEDYNKFKPVFDAHESMRSQGGSRGGKVFRSTNDPNEIFVLLEWDSLQNAQKFVQSDSIKEAMKSSGVVGMPSIYFVEEAAAVSK